MFTSPHHRTPRQQAGLRQRLDMLLGVLSTLAILSTGAFIYSSIVASTAVESIPIAVIAVGLWIATIVTVIYRRSL